MKILIQGTGAAASCAAHLLRNSGMEVLTSIPRRAGVPAIMLGDTAMHLLRDVFGNPALLRPAHRIRRRVVQWGVGARPVSLEHSALVVSEQELLAELQPHTALENSAAAQQDFTIFASRPLPPESKEHAFGARMASATRVLLRDAADSETCWIESLEDGWLFLIPNSPGAGWLLSVGSSASSALDRSRLIGSRIEVPESSAGEFPAGPRIVSPLAGGGWLACGSAALGFDPICGDGTAHAVREAILASAVIRAIARGVESAAMPAHYEARLTAGLARHLLACREFYRTGEKGSWWEGELQALECGLEWCAARMKTFGPFRYALRGYDLVPAGE